MPIRHALLALLVVAIWGFNFTIIKMSVIAMPPMLAAALRFTFTAFPVILFIKPPKTSWWLIIGFGLSFDFALYALLNFSFHVGMQAGLASVVLQVQAFFTFLLAFLLLGERPRLVQILGGAVAFAGIGVIIFERMEGAAFVPILFTIAAAVAWALANVIARKGGHINPVALTVWGALVGAVPLYGLSFWLEGGLEPLIEVVTHPSWNVAIMIGFLAYPASLLGVIIWNWLLGKHPASVVAPFTLLVPITGLLSGWLMLGERITSLEMVGGALVVAGLGVTLIKRKRPTDLTPT